MKRKTEMALMTWQKHWGASLGGLMMAQALLRLFQTYNLRYDEASYSRILGVEIGLLGLLVAGALGYWIVSRLKARESFPLLKQRVKALMIPEQKLLIVLFAWYVLSCMASNVNFSGRAFAFNRSSLLDTAVSFFIFFPMIGYLANHAGKVVRGITPILLTILAAGMIYILWNVFHLNIIETPDNAIGMTATLNLNISANYNTVGAYAAVSSLVCIAWALRTRRVYLKLVYIVFTLVHWVALMLTQSRTAIVSAVFAFSVGVFALLYFKLKDKVKFLPRMVICLAAAIVSGIVLLQSRQWVFDLFQSISHFSERVNQGRQQTATSLREITVDGSVFARFDLWLAAIKSMVFDLKHFLFGATPVGVSAMLDYVMNANFGMYTHNQFLEMGVAFGVPGMLLYTAWLVLVARACLRIGLNRSENVKSADRAVPVVVLSLVVANLTEAMLVGCSYMPGSLFFLLSGWVCVKARNLPPVSVRDLIA